jgi:hypothetical protein
MISTNEIKECISLGQSSGFYGYGKWESEIYIIGIEEAGCYSESLIQQKIDKYFSLNGGDDGLFDNRSFQFDLVDENDTKLKYYSDFFNGNTKKGGYVPKIADLLKVLEDSNLEKYEYVQNKFGSRESNHSLIEIFPLPCPNESDWRHPDWVNCTELSFMSYKVSYKNEIIKRRINHIKTKIESHKEKKLILFLADGTSKIEYWNQISPVHIAQFDVNQYNIRYHIEGNKMYVVLPFPGSRNSNSIFNSSDEIISVAQSIKELYNTI